MKASEWAEMLYQTALDTRFTENLVTITTAQARELAALLRGLQDQRDRACAPLEARIKLLRDALDRPAHCYECNGEGDISAALAATEVKP